MRAKDEDGRLLDPPHKRLPNAAALEQAGVLAISKDGRSAHLTLMRKLSIVRKVIDHIVDGDAIPKAISKPDPDRPDEKAMLEFWRAAEVAVRAAR